MDIENHQIKISWVILNSTGSVCIKRWQCHRNHLETTEILIALFCQPCSFLGKDVFMNYMYNKNSI